MSLNEKPSITNWPATHYIFVEKIGPFQETAQLAWQELHSQMSEIVKANQIQGFMSLYKVEPQMLYRAGVAVAAKPSQTLPSHLKYEFFEGGKYSKFTLTGSYSQLPEACGRVFELVEQIPIVLRAEAYFIENYLNDPKTTPEDQLITEILMPTK